MPSITECWAPCFQLNKSNMVDLETGSKLIAYYTALVHFLTGFYGIYVVTGGRTDTFYSPLFEFDKTGMYWIASFIIVYSLFFIVCCSYGLIYGIKSETRFYYLPFLYCTSIELVAMVTFGIFMVYRYYHYYWATFASLILWSYSGYHGYLYWVVISQYYLLKNLQEPTFIILYP